MGDWLFLTTAITITGMLLYVTNYLALRSVITRRESTVIRSLCNGTSVSSDLSKNKAEYSALNASRRRLREGVTDLRTVGQTLLQKCEDASKKKIKWTFALSLTQREPAQHDRANSKSFCWWMWIAYKRLRYLTITLNHPSLSKSRAFSLNNFDFEIALESFESTSRDSMDLKRTYAII